MQTQRYHNIVDLDHCNNRINDPEALTAFLKSLVTATNMSILAGPLSATGIPENPGYSLFVIVDFSHISIHTFTNANEALIDIFSCKPYDREKILKLCKDFFSTAETTAREKEVWWGN